MKLESATAGDLMSTKVVSIERYETLEEAIRQMRDHRVHCLLVLPDSPARGIGVLAGKDCIHVLADSGPEGLRGLHVEDVMTLPAVTVPAGLCLLDCVRLMRHAGVRSAPVVENSELVGILSFTDVLNAVVSPDMTD